MKREQIDNPDFRLECLLTDVLAAVRPFAQEQKTRIPVIAAGGIFTGADIYKFLHLGAAGVQMGTRFVGTHECDADDAFKQAYVDAKEEDIVIIESPVGLPGRVLQNTFLDEVNAGARIPFSCPYHCIVTCDYKETSYCIARALVNAKKGRLKHGFVFAGKNAYRVDRIVSVKELIDLLRKEYTDTCASMPTHNATPGVVGIDC